MYSATTKSGSAGCHQAKDTGRLQRSAVRMSAIACSFNTNDKTDQRVNTYSNWQHVNHSKSVRL